MRATALAALSFAAAVGAQTVIDSHGIRTPGATIDARGIHTPGGSVGAAGVQAAGAGSGTTIITNGSHRVIDCRGAGLTVSGNGNLIKAANCREVVVAGNGNLLSVRFGGPGRLSVVGNNDQVRWGAPHGVAVSVSAVGYNAKVGRVR